MSQWLKLSQCLYTPAAQFTIFDYTKLVFAIDCAFYLKQIITSQKSQFLKISHPSTILEIFSSPTALITIQKWNQMYYVGFYPPNDEEQLIKLSLSVQGKIRALYHDNVLYVVSCCETTGSNQIVFFYCGGQGKGETKGDSSGETKGVIGRGFVEGVVRDVAIGPNYCVSLWVGGSVVGYKCEQLGDPEARGIGKVYKELEVDITVDIQKHCWIQDQLLIWGNNKAYIVIKNKICQQFNDFHRLHNAAPLICGFLACDGCVIKVYKKQNIKYELICEFTDQFLMQCSNICLSPQQDIFSYFTPVTNSIIIATNFSQQIQQLQEQESQSQGHMIRQLKTRQISHSKAYDYAVYASNQAWFAAANGSQLQLINSHNFSQFLCIQLTQTQKQSIMSTSSGQQKIRYVAIHPNRPILAIALKKCIKIYYLTFNQLRLLKELPISLCGNIIFNNSGSLLTAIVSGKNGAKIYTYAINELRSQYSLVETLSIGKKPLAIKWNSQDTRLFCFFQDGYYMWNMDTKLRVREDIDVKIGWQVQGVTILGEQIVYWGAERLAIINEGNMAQQIMKGVQVKRVFWDGESYFVVVEDGRIGRGKNLDLDAILSKAFDLNTNGKKFQIQMQQNSKFILITQNLNLRFYEFGQGNNLFTDVVGIQKKKLYSIMGKHEQYEQQIKKLKQDFTNVVLQIKNSNIIEQKRIQEQYRIQLRDHIDREKKVKEEKSKLQQTMQKNLQIKEKETMNQIKQLEKLYERKIALTTNKLLTQKQIGFRDRLTSENRLKLLEERHYSNIQQIRVQFAEHLRANILDKAEAQKQINSIKKDYQSRLYQLQQQNQILLRGLQDKNENSLISLKKTVNNWQNKYSECISQKDNLQKQCRQQQINCQILKQKISFLQTRKAESDRRCDNLSNQIIKVEKVLEERNKLLQFNQKRIADLEKANEILKYRVLEIKQQNDPYEDEITKLKANLNDLEQQYQKLLKYSHEQEQKMQITKKQKSKLKQQSEIVSQKYKKMSKRHEQLVDKIRQTTKSPIQEIRKQLLAIVDSYAKIQKSYSVLQKRNDSPLAELNRIRDHLQVCLDQATTANKKNQEQRKIQIMKKNQENSELLTEINTMRKKIRILEDQIKQKNLQISRLIRGQTPSLTIKQQKVSTTQANSKQFTKTRSRETFYQKSMFRSGHHWNSKRLKTEQGSRRKKSSHSMMRDRNPNASLAIHPQAQQIQQYKRIIEQKDIFIQKLIAKIQKS